MHLGHAPTLVVSSAEFSIEIMRTHDIVFSNSPKTTAEDILYYGCTDIGFAPMVITGDKLGKYVF